MCPCPEFESQLEHLSWKTKNIALEMQSTLKNTIHKKDLKDLSKQTKLAWLLQ